MKALTPALGTHPHWCRMEVCDSTIAGDGTVETGHDYRVVATVETEHEYRYPVTVELTQLDVKARGEAGRSTRSIFVNGQHASFSLAPRQAVALGWALLWAAVRMVVGR